LIHCIEDILREYGALLSRVASTYEASDSIRQELYQEICVAVWQGLERFKGDAGIKTYILRIAHNRCISHVSKESKAIKSSPLPDAETNAETRFCQDHQQDNQHYLSVNLEQKMQQSQQLARLLSAVRDLKMPARQVITLSMEGLSYQEIAEVTGLSVNNIGVMIARLKKELQRKLQDDK
jgi:RNA polymerase sigma-70 factor (ECF subfamily)